MCGPRPSPIRTVCRDGLDSWRGLELRCHEQLYLRWVWLCRQSVVLVSVNYRMNAFGFMAHPELSAESERGVSGNYGILDHIAALEWSVTTSAALAGSQQCDRLW